MTDPRIVKGIPVHTPDFHHTPIPNKLHVQMTPASAIHEFRSVHGECPEIPDDLSIPQFFLDTWHPLRPRRPVGSPWVIDDESGKVLDYEQVSCVL